MLAGGEQEDPAVGGQLEIGRNGELPGALAVLAESPEQAAVRREDLELDVAPVQDEDVALAVDPEVDRPVEDGFSSPASPPMVSSSARA